MAKECEISSRMDLTKEEAISEYIELREYLQSENWVSAVIEKVERRMSDLAKILMNHAIKDRSI